jgi:hypothetical protein
MPYICYFQLSDTQLEFATLEAARAAAEAYVGNRSAAKPFPSEDTYLYGPGNGDTTVMVRRKWKMRDGRLAAAPDGG